MQQVVDCQGASRPLLRRIHAFLMLGCLAVGAAAASGACSTSGDGPGDSSGECIGGVVVNGVCEGKCKPELCLEGNTCVGNRCVLKCSSHLECYPGIQDCAPAEEDDTGEKIMVCTGNGRPVGYGAPCPFGVECSGFGSCPDGTPCSLAQCNFNPGDCVRDAEACGDDPDCFAGKCSDGSACVVQPCPIEQCTSLGLECRTRGEGDAEAYCAKPHCSTDADCPGGYECAITRDPHAICNTNPKKGNNSFCGVTDEACIDRDDFEANGSTFFEGAICLLRKACVKRSQCSPCTSDLDCSLVPGLRCVPIGGENRCARSCSRREDCDLDHECVEIDEETSACVPRFGACVGSGNFCEPCVNDEDCGGVGTTMACVTNLRGERACLDLAFPHECTTDDDCPTSPSGRHGSCNDEGRCSLPLYRRDPRDPESLVQSCW